jgi:hypothetical protein
MVKKVKCNYCGKEMSPHAKYMHIMHDHDDLVGRWSEIKDTAFTELEKTEEEYTQEPKILADYLLQNISAKGAHDLLSSFGIEIAQNTLSTWKRTAEDKMIDPAELDEALRVLNIPKEDMEKGLEEILKKEQEEERQKQKGLIKSETVKKPERKTDLERNLEDPNTILKEVFARYEGSKTLDEDTVAYITDLADSAGYITPGELRNHLLECGVATQTATKLYRLYNLKYQNWQNKSRSNAGYEPDIESKEPEIIRKIPTITTKASDYYGNIETVEPRTEIPVMRRKTYKTTIDGQTFETTDPAEYFAWRRYLDEKKEAEERAKIEAEERERLKVKHDLEMEKLREEIKNIAASRSSGVEREEEENTVPLEIEDGIKINVSPKDAFFYYMLRNQQSQKGGESEEEKIPITIEGQTVKVNPLVAALVEGKKIDRDAKLEEIKKENELLKTRLDSAISAIKNIKAEDLVKGQTAMDVIDKRMKEMHELGKTIVNKLPFPKGGELEYEAERTPTERKELAQQIESKLDKKAEEIEAENEFVEFVRSM